VQWLARWSAIHKQPPPRQNDRGRTLRLFTKRSINMYSSFSHFSVATARERTVSMNIGDDILQLHQLRVFFRVLFAYVSGHFLTPEDGSPPQRPGGFTPTKTRQFAQALSYTSLSWVVKTQLDHWTKWVVNTKLMT